MPDDHVPRRVAALQPSISITLRDLGLLDRLAACTKYCVEACPEIAELGCVIVEDSWTAKASEILAAKPDLVMASVPYQVESLTEIMKCGIPFIAMAPKSLADVYADMLLIARIMGAPDRGAALVQRMKAEIETVREQTAGAPRPLVYCEEWGKPLIFSQPWVAELVDAAGGRFLGEPGKQTTAESVLAADPDVMIAAWCGAGDRVPLEKTIARRGWDESKAAAAGRVYCVQDELLNTPASNLLDGLHALAAAIHPELFLVEIGLRRILPHSERSEKSLPASEVIG
ncbi:MAG TPA: ABC transporter substrate-binding protein [Verrucomicrobiae bacterium]|jgi:iron complex transport system substrate-binding protein|nr:ABC transporter substrate-binding protein [Verrucomicrobiae bacterium]